MRAITANIYARILFLDILDILYLSSSMYSLARRYICHPGGIIARDPGDKYRFLITTGFLPSQE